MPTPIAVLSWVGTERKTAVRSPVSTRTAMITPSMTTRPIASAQVIFGAISYATSALTPRPAASAEREPADDAHQDGHQPGDQRGRRGERGDGQRLAVAVDGRPPRISGLSTTMYAIVKKVARPPRISRDKVDLRAVISKYLSKKLVGPDGDGWPDVDDSVVVLTVFSLLCAGQYPDSGTIRRSPQGPRRSATFSPGPLASTAAIARASWPQTKVMIMGMRTASARAELAARTRTRHLRNPVIRVIAARPTTGPLAATWRSVMPLEQRRIARPALAVGDDVGGG